MKKEKNSEGISLISVIIAVIVMSILVVTATYSGISNYREAKVTQFTTQMQMIQSKVDDLVTQKSYNQIGSSITEEQKGILTAAYNNNEISNNSNEYFNKFKYLNKTILKDLDLENIELEVLVNFETREVVSIDGVEYKNVKYYTQYLLPNGQALISSTHQDRNYTFIQSNISRTVDGLNCMVEITAPITNGTLSYKDEETDTWTTITNYTKKNESYSVNITKTSEYSFKLMDNTSQTVELIENVKIVLTNKPKTTELIEPYDYFDLESTNNWAYIEHENDTYVWLPRFVYKYDSENDEYECKFIKGNSNIATDETYINSSEWSIPKVFENKPNATGIWVLAEEINDIIDAITDNSLDGILEITNNE